MTPDRVTIITRQLGAWYEAGQLGHAQVLPTLRQQGVTHLYFGARNTTPLRTAIAGSPPVSRVYAEENVEIYAFR